MCSVGVISYVRRWARRLVRERRGRGVGGSEVTVYVVHAGGGWRASLGTRTDWPLPFFLVFIAKVKVCFSGSALLFIF